MEDNDDDDDDNPMKWKSQGQRGAKGKVKSKKNLKVNKTYTTRSVEKKLLGDVVKANKSATTRRRWMKNAIIINEENFDVVDVGEGEGDIDTDIVDATAKRRTEA